MDNEGQSAVMGPYTAELETRKYYYFGGQRVSMRVVTATTNQVYYLHGDHLGSVSLTTDSNGAVVAQARYMPYGEVRWESSPSPSDYGFTGQRLDGFGLMDFNARFYSARLGRFISADPLVPNPGDASSFDRYAFVNNNPIRYVDPTGHIACNDPMLGGSEVCDKENPEEFGVEKPFVVPRNQWADLGPGSGKRYILGGNHTNCYSWGEVEGYYDLTNNPGGYAPYSELSPNEELEDVLDTVVIHHEGDFQDYDVQEILYQHMVINGWYDIGYHYIIGPDGTIYEGRYIGVRGAHVEGENSGNIGILLLGDFNPGMELGSFHIGFDLYHGDDVGPTEAQIVSTTNLIIWLDSEYGIDSVVGHSDIPRQNTVCPGSKCRPYINQWNQMVK